MLQVNVPAVSIPSYEGVSGQACAELLNISQDEEFFLVYWGMTLDRTLGKSDTFRGRHCSRFSGTQFDHPKSTEVLIKVSVSTSVLVLRQAQLVICQASWSVCGD